LFFAEEYSREMLYLEISGGIAGKDMFFYNNPH
jgi:hypothetical protein